MANICKQTENYFNQTFTYHQKVGITESIASSVVECSKVMDVKVIVASTVSGYSARRISNLKPNSMILATCTTEKVARSLALNYGVITTVVPLSDNTDEVVRIGLEKATEMFNLKTNDKVIITGGLPAESKKRVTNFMKIEEI
jgi:pyruvate kinase